MADLSEFLDVIRGASTEELKQFKSIIEGKLTGSFRAGDRVTFDGRGRQLTGIITRMNRKSASVVVDGGARWTVHPSFLTKVS